MDYYSKYLKYKSKYLELKAQLGSGGTQISKLKCLAYITINNEYIRCGCNDYKQGDTLDICGSKYIYNNNTYTCGHHQNKHETLRRISTRND